MAKWKLVRQTFGNEEFTLSEGDEVTIGRGKHNTISLTSIVVSRDHCVLSVRNKEVKLTDLKSSNGVYIGKKKIPTNIPYIVKNLDIIGLGWSASTALVDINDSEKYVFKLVRETPLNERTELQDENEYDEIENKIALLDDSNVNIVNKIEPEVANKRKLDDHFKTKNIKLEVIEKNSDCPFVTIDDFINISDSESESTLKKAKLEEKPEKAEKINVKAEPIKLELDLEFEAFDVKQEYLGYDNEPLQVDSDSDSESDQWFMRLSQNSPGKPFTKRQNKNEDIQENSSYSQIDDFIQSRSDDEEIFEHDLITILPQRLEYDSTEHKAGALQSSPKGNSNDHKQIQSNNVTSTIGTLCDPLMSKVPDQTLSDYVNEFSSIEQPHTVKDIEPSSAALELENSRKIQCIQPLPRKNKDIINKAIHLRGVDRNHRRNTKHNRITKYKPGKKELSSSQKEERKRKLKEIASKGRPKESNCSSSIDTSTTKTVNNVKVTSTNRGAFLTSHSEASVEVVDKPKRLSEIQKNKDKIYEQSSKKSVKVDKNIDKKKEIQSQTNKIEKCNKDKENSSINKSKPRILNARCSNETSEVQELLTILKPPTARKSANKKSVRFSVTEPEIHTYEIEPGNKMKKTSLIKTTLVDIRQMPVFSLEKLTLMKILRWNPHWLEEQMNNNDPPPILGHNNPPMSIFHSFVNHHQYVQLIGNLLLMEIWECLTIGYKKILNGIESIQMRIESLPPVPTQDRYFELFNLSVNVSLPTAKARIVPKVGDVIIVDFGPEDAKNQRFFFVHNVRCLPSPANNINSFFSISLHATFTEKMRLLRPGEVMLGRPLADIRKELMLFEAMEQLAGSPLSEAILRPEPHHFPKMQLNPDIRSQWTATLNPSQQLAVCSSVTAALSDRPSVQMVQGPPGTGKSSVICAIVMTYFYGDHGKKHQNRGKILICATSNAAVDELVIRLLNIRQSLPKSERFRMVRVGRVEAMHPRARDVSSQQLAQRDLAHAPAALPAHPGLASEISHLEAKINMWKTAAQDVKDPVRVAYCQGRITELVKRISLVRAGGAPRPPQLAQAECRIVEGADILITTLASAHNYKMRGLKRRIALCIVDEAGQAIEPETLIPLTLDVTRLTLIGDPQQLPGYICSQRAKRHGLSESLFSRLASCGEQWPSGSPAVLLDQQYRMHPSIADYPNRAFYGGRVTSVPPRRPDLPLTPYALVCISSGDKGQGACGANETEAWGVARLGAALAGLLRPRALSLAIITPYHAHKDLIKKCLRTLYNIKAEAAEEGPVEVNTVDSFQGQERDVVLVSLARSHGVGFLTDAGRMNVMLTRARHALLICLNPHAMLKNAQWRTLVEDAQRRRVYKELPYKMCQPLTASQAPSDDTIGYIMSTLTLDPKR